MNLAEERKLSTWLLNPFAYVAGSKSLGIGVAVLILTGLVGALGNTHFDGVLDTHTGRPAPMWFFMAEGFIDWLSMGVVMWLMGRLVSHTSFRAVDLFGTQAMARWPAVLIALLTLIPGYQRFTTYLASQILKPGAQLNFNTPDAAFFGIIVLFILVLLIWMIALMWKSYSVSCNAKGPSAAISFIIGILLAECLSKFGMLGLLKYI